MKHDNRKRGQEEMIGFALIIVIVSVILLIVLSLSLGGDDTDLTQSVELDSFLQSFQTVTTTCQSFFGPLTLQELIFACNEQDLCLDERSACSVLNETVAEALAASFFVGAERPLKGYAINITSEAGVLYAEQQGTMTVNARSARQTLVRQGSTLEMVLRVYS